MSRYNVQKRATLDRLTERYRLRMRSVLRDAFEEEIGRVADALDDGRRAYQPDGVDRIEDRFTSIFRTHRDQVVHVAVSDGIQEVTPDNRLGLWRLFPDTAHIEDTLTPRLAAERDKLAAEIRKRLGHKLQFTPEDLALLQREDFLKLLKGAYRKLADSWVKGESTMDDVRVILQEALRSSDAEAERIFRTETTRYFNETRYDYFSNNTAMQYMQLYAVTDGRTSNICEARHGFVVTMDRAGLPRYMPPFHPHCRTVQRPLTLLIASQATLIERGLAMDESRFPPTAWAA